nr:MAG: hypothetical protein [Microvirus sp.]
MTIRVFKLSDWQLLPVGHDLELALDTPGRKVTIQFNTVLPARIGWVAEGGEQSVLLGVVEGRDDVEFRPTGPGKVTVESEGEVWFYTDDGEQTVAGDGAQQETYLKLLQPRDRAEELERMLALQSARHNALMAAQQADRAALLERIAAQEAALKEAANGADAGGVGHGAAQADSGAGSASDTAQTAEGAGGATTT